MIKTDLISQKNKERNRMRRLLKESGVEEWRIKMLDKVLDKTALMCVKLEDTAQRLENADVVVEYDNGGGQKGIKQNPLFQGYEALWKSYMLGMGQIMAAAGTKADTKAEKLKPTSVIALVRSNQQQA